MTDPLAIYGHCHEVGECYEWAGRFSSNGHPRAMHEGREWLIRRLLLELVNGEPVPGRLNASMSCRNSRCVRVEHISLRTTKQIAVLAAKEGAFSTVQRKLAMARGARKRAKLSEAQALEIRSSLEPGPALAKRFGVNRSLVQRIRRRQAWAYLGGAPNSSIFRMETR